MKGKKIVSLLMIGILVACFSMTAFASFEELNVPKYTQEKSMWCWAAAAQMAGKYKYSTSDATQTDIVTYVKGSAVNNEGSIFETANATEYVTNNTYGLSTAWISKWGWDKVKTSIDNGYPVIALVDGGGSGHYYVIRGYDASTNKIALNDPWDGERKTCSWDDFNDGSWGDESRPYKYTVYFDNYNG